MSRMRLFNARLVFTHTNRAMVNYFAKWYSKMQIHFNGRQMKVQAITLKAAISSQHTFSITFANTAMRNMNSSVQYYLKLNWSFFASVIWRILWMCFLIAICVIRSTKDSALPYTRFLSFAKYWYTWMSSDLKWSQRNSVDEFAMK